MEELIRFGKPAETKAGHLKSEFRPLFDEKAYCEKVEQVKHYIHEGDLFQLVLSNRLEADLREASSIRTASSARRTRRRTCSTSRVMMSRSPVHPRKLS